MTAAHDIDLRQLVEDRLTGAPGPLRELLTLVIHALISAEADVLCGRLRAPHQLPQRLSAPRLRHPRWNPRHRDPQAAVWQLLHRLHGLPCNTEQAARVWL